MFQNISFFTALTIKSHKIGDGNFKRIKWKNKKYVSLVKYDSNQDFY